MDQRLGGLPTTRAISQISRLLLLLGLVAVSVNRAAYAQSFRAPDLQPQRPSELRLNTALSTPVCLDTQGGNNGFVYKPHNLVYRAIAAGLKGTVYKGVWIVGGLLPTPNIAAKAGDIDPIYASMAWVDPIIAGGGPISMQDFRVGHPRPLLFRISCPSSQP